MNTQPLELDGNDKLHWLRRLDRARSWEFLDDQRCCVSCGKTFTGRQVRLAGGTRPLGPLHLVCPTRHCSATPADWVYLHEAAGQASQPSRIPTARVVRIKRKRTTRGAAFPAPLVPLRQLAFWRMGFRLLRHVGVAT